MVCLNNKTSDSPQKLPNSDDILPELNDYATAVYEGGKKIYIEKVIDVDQTDANVTSSTKNEKSLETSFLLSQEKRTRFGLN